MWFTQSYVEVEVVVYLTSSCVNWFFFGSGQV
jgi:hypothetical protein